MDKLKKNSKVDYTSVLSDSKFFNEKSLYSYPSISHKIKEGDFCNFETNSFLKLFELISP